MSTEESKVISVFFSYASEDEALMHELVKQLAFLQRLGFISGWNDRDIKAGQEWIAEINEKLNSADIILLLISPDFIASDYCYSVEMTRAMQRHDAGEAIVIPLILRPTYWHDAPFSRLRALPANRKPVTSWPDIDEAFLDIVRGIRKVVFDILKQQEVNPGRPSSTLPRDHDFAPTPLEKTFELYPNSIIGNPVIPWIPWPDFRAGFIGNRLNYQQHVFYRGIDDNIHHIWRIPTKDILHWDTWTHDAQGVGDPAATLTYPSFQHVFYRGSDNNIYRVWWNDPDGNSKPADQWTTDSQVAGDPTALWSDSPNQQHVFYRGSDSNIHHLWQEFSKPFHSPNRDQWTTDSQVAGDPTALWTDSPNQQHVFYRGIDSNIHHVWWDHLSWSLYRDQWTTDSQVAGNPIALWTDFPNQQHVFYRGIDNNIHHVWWDHLSRSLYRDQWTRDSMVAGDPTVLPSNYQQHIFYRGADNNIYHVWWNQPTGPLNPPEQWTNNSQAVSDPTTLWADPSNQLNVFYRSVDNNIHHVWKDSEVNPRSADDEATI